MTSPIRAESMTLIARSFVYAVIGLGGLVLAANVAGWSLDDAPRFLCFLVLTVVASTLRLSIPTLTGTISANFLFILICVVELTMPETLVIGVCATLVQSFLHSRPQMHPVQIAFNAASMAIAVAAASKAHHAVFLKDPALNSPLTLICAAVAFFAMNTFPIATVIGLLERRTIKTVWQEYYFSTLPYYISGALLAGLLHYANRAVGWQTSLLATPVLYLLYRSFVLYLTQFESAKTHAQELSSLNFRTIETLALAIEAKDHTTGDHLRRVQIYAMAIGRELGLAGTDLEALQAAALLHDIGKLAVPEYIISKPGKLTPEEFEKMKIHPVVGAEILERVKFPYPVVPIVRSHHEKWNGGGYPDGLRGEQIPLGARILSAVDCLDALASDRQYRKALPLDEAIKIVIAEAGTSFDPKVVAILARRYVELEHLAVTESGADQGAKLSVDVKVARGLAPAAGFAEPTALPPSERRRADLDCIEIIVSARQQVQMLFDLASSNVMNISLDEALSVFAVRLKQLVHYDSMAVYIKSGDVLVPSYVTGDDFRLFSSLRIPFGQGLSGWALENDKTILNGNPAVEPGYLNDPSVFTKLRSALVVPLTGAHGAIGVLALYDHNRDAFSQEQLRVLQAIGSKLASVVEKFTGNVDAGSVEPAGSLAELPDARALFLYLNQLLADGKEPHAPLAVIVCALHGFSQIKERSDSEELNHVLLGVGNALESACADNGGYLAHTGADEFVVVMPGVTLERTQAVCAQLSFAVSRSMQMFSFGHSVSLVTGAAHYPEDGMLPEQLLAEADRKVIKAKRSLRALPARAGAGTVHWRTAMTQ